MATLSRERKNNDPADTPTAKIQPRDSHGRFISALTTPSTPKLDLKQSSTSRSSTSIRIYTSPSKTPEPPLVNFQISNPVTYLKAWWKRIMANEGIDFRFRIRPVTAIAITTTLIAGSFGLGRITLPPSNPIIKYIPQLAPTPTPNPWRDTAFSGLLKQSVNRFYLVTSDAEAITLEVPTNVNLVKYIGKRIFATGRYNQTTGILHVTDASDLEVLIQSAPIPTIIITATPTITPTLTPTETSL